MVPDDVKDPVDISVPMSGISKERHLSSFSSISRHLRDVAVPHDAGVRVSSWPCQPLSPTGSSSSSG